MNEQQIHDAALVAYAAARCWNQQIGVFDDLPWCDMADSEKTAWVAVCAAFINDGTPLVPEDELSNATPLQALRVPLVAAILNTFKERQT